MLVRGPVMTGCLHVADGSPAVINFGLGAVALKYQRLGYSVLALAPATKRPHKLFQGGGDGTAGVHWATTDPRMVEWAWGQDRLAGIGIACGKASGLVVVDLDVKSGANGMAELDSFMAAWSLELPGGPFQVTPSGGIHLWFRLPPGLALPGRTSILPGVDIKSDGGYVVAAPTHIWVESMDGGRALLPYRMNGCPCALPWLPDWLADWVLHAPGEAASEGGPGGEHGELPELAEFQQHGLPRGERNVTLHRLACRLFRQYGTTPQGVLAVRGALQQVLDNTDRRGFTEHEITTSIQSARRWVQQQMNREAEAWQSFHQTTSQG